MLLLAGCAGSQVYVGAEAGPVEVTVAVDQNRHISVSGGVSPKFKIGLGPVELKVGIQQTIELTKEKPFTLFIIWEDESGELQREEYVIGKAFHVKFTQNELIQEIQGENNSVIVVIKRPSSGPMPSEEPQVLATKVHSITVDGSPDDWQEVDYIELIDKESDLTQLDGISDPQAARWIDYKRIRYHIQDQVLYLLMEFYGDINQNNPETALIGYGISFRNDPRLDTSPILSLDYLPNVGTELYLFENNKMQRLDGQGIENGYRRNFVELALPIRTISDYISTPYFNYISYRNVNEGCEPGDTLICSYRIGDWDLNQYIFMALYP
jgi:hypothetical protein